MIFQIQRISYKKFALYPSYMHPCLYCKEPSFTCVFTIIGRCGESDGNASFKEFLKGNLNGIEMKPSRRDLPFV